VVGGIRRFISPTVSCYCYFVLLFEHITFSLTHPHLYEQSALPEPRTAVPDSQSESDITCIFYIKQPPMQASPTPTPSSQDLRTCDERARPCTEPERSPPLEPRRHRAHEPAPQKPALQSQTGTVHSPYQSPIMC